MAQTRAPIEAGAGACPFVALEFDRDRRSDQPDVRHRCYAEPVPAPRTIAHQERFCLSPDFPACPVFQEWAMRAAAQTVPASSLPDERRTDSSPTAAAAATAAANQEWPDSMDASLAAYEEDEPQVEQLFAFEAQPVDPEDVAPLPRASIREEPEPDDADADAVPMPTFLEARSTRHWSSVDAAQVSRTDIVPPAAIDQRRAAEGDSDADGDGPFSRLLTIVAVVIILALGVATVLIVPGLLAGDSGQSARPSLIAATSVPGTSLATSVAVLPSDSSALPTPPVTEVIPTSAATPAATPLTYKIKVGDTLKRIARDFGVTVEQILAANPEIPDADHIEIGQRIVIPSP